MSDSEALARADEERYVHSVYESIAEHFSRTRYKPWPGITAFFDSLPAGSLGIDAGCGNGKYLGLRSLVVLEQQARVAEASASSKSKGKRKAVEHESGPSAVQTAAKGPIFTIGLDRSHGLTGIAHERGHEVLVGDAIDMPWREGAFDFAISIATIHHFSTPARRIEAIKTMLKALDRKRGKLFIQVWAVEQEPPDHRSTSDQPAQPSEPVLRKQRQMSKLEPATLSHSDSDQAQQDVFVPWKLQPKPGQTPETSGATSEGNPAPNATYQRYYHLFRGGELKDLVQRAAKGLDCASTLVIDESEEWEQGNWCIRASFSDYNSSHSTTSKSR